MSWTWRYWALFIFGAIATPAIYGSDKVTHGVYIALLMAGMYLLGGSESERGSRPGEREGR